MSNFLPLYQFPCIVPDTTSSNAVFLAGVTNERRLEINRVSLSNVNAPSNTLVMQHTNVSSLVPDVEKHCDIFVGDFVSGGAPFVISQFASAADILLEGSATVVRANGTIVPQENSFVRYTQPKLFSITGVSGKSLWYTAFAESPSDETGSAWFAIVIRDDGSRSSYSYKLSTFPTSTPLLSVGTYTTSAFLPITGHLSVFDVDGRGVVYTVSSRDYINNSTTIQTLSNPISINMNGIKLTPSAFPVTLGDKGSSANLGGTQIVLYGGWDDSDQPTNDFHVYDTITNLWEARSQAS
ncbi:hypothetical protein BGW41_006318 [Actinomortierella wolfii]|nr:hypothetical protein BGW41_006318 [Actinomortierella wolfii]